MDALLSVTRNKRAHSADWDADVEAVVGCKRLSLLTFFDADKESKIKPDS